MKNHRGVCLATYAGYVEYSGLPGRLRTGCPNTPDYKSSYCSLHKPVIASAHHDGDANDSSIQKKEPIGLIIGKRETRSCTLYQVNLVLCVDAYLQWKLTSIFHSLSSVCYR